MVPHQHLSHREKILAAIAGALLIGFFLVGYARAAEINTTSSSTKVEAPAPTPDQLKQREEDKKNQLNHIKGEQTRAKNMRREIDDIKREVKTGLDTNIADKKHADFVSCIDKLNGLVGTPEFWNSNRDCEDFIRAVDNELETKIRPARDCANNRRGFEDRKKELKNLDKQIKEILRNDKNTDVSVLNKLVADITAALAKSETLVTNACTRESNDSLNDISRYVNDYFQDFYTLSGEMHEKTNTARQFSENKKNFEKDIKRQCEKEYTREIKNLEKEFTKVQKIGPIQPETQKSYDLIKQRYNDLCVVQLTAMQKALDTSNIEAFNDARNEFHSINQDFWGALEEVRNLLNQPQQLKDVTRDISQREKELKNMKREYERAVKKTGGIQDTALADLLKKYETLLNEAKTAINKDPQSWWSGYQQDLNDLQNEFWQSQEKVQSLGDAARWIKDIDRELKGKEKELKNLKKEADAETYAKLENILAQSKRFLEQAKNLLSTDPEGARDTLQQMDELRMEWDETSRSVYDSKQMIFEMEEVRRQAQYASQRITELLLAGEISQQEAVVCKDFISEVLKRISQTKIDPGQDPHEFFEDIEDKAIEVCPAFERIGDAPPPDRRYYEKFMHENLSGVVDKSIAETVIQNVSQDVISKVIQRLISDPNVVQNLVRVAGDKYKISATGALEAASNFYDENTQKQLLAKKTEILDLTNQLENIKTQVKIAQDKLQDLQKIQDELAGYNFYGSGGEAIRGEIEAFIEKTQKKGLSKEEIKAGIEELRKKKDSAITDSKRAKFDAQIIPFLDTDDNVWYTKFVAPLAKLGIVRGKGDGNSFDPSGQVTIAEVLTMTFRLSHDDEVDGESTLCDGKFRSHWANKFIHWGEARRLSIVKRCNDINRPALRWEVAQILLETARDGSVPESSEQCFSDVKPSDSGVNAAVCLAQKEGVLKGQDGRANAYANIIRAEAATMVKQAAEKLFGFSFEEKEEKQKREEERPKARGSSRDRNDEDFESDEDENDFGEEEEEERDNDYEDEVKSMPRTFK